MPNEQILRSKYINVTGTIPTASGTSTTGVTNWAPSGGHATRHEGTGRWFFNQPSANYAYMPRAPLYNCVDLVEYFQQKPGINGNSDVPSADTYNTAQMQLGLDANRNFEIAGTNGTTALCTFADGGGITLTTATSSNDQMLLQAHTNTNATQWAAAKWNTLDNILFETVIKTGSAVTSQKLFAGWKLTNTPLTATDNDQAYFLFDTGNTNSVSAVNWQICTSRTNVDTFVDSGVVVAAATSYHLLISVDPNRIPYFWINGVLVGVGNVAGTGITAAATTSAGALITDVDLKPFIGVQTLTTAAKAITVRGIHCGKLYND